MKCIYQISTHTLTWSVTFTSADTSLNLVISTHTLTWSVTLQRCNLQNLFYYFNSHAHVERDSALKSYTTLFFISTHTLTWSVTCDVVIIFCHFFISTHTLTWSVTTG